MKVEGWLFVGCAAFFAVMDVIYWHYSKDPTGTTALAGGAYSPAYGAT